MPPETTPAAALLSQPPLASPRETLTRLRTAATHVDPVLMALAALLAGLWAFDAALAWMTAGYVINELAHIAPWLAASVIIAAAAGATGADALAGRAFTGREGA